jgi:drug/metabolite transporter (DMT)-like permease
VGELFALARAVVWALAVILFRRCGETVAPLALNLFRVVVSSVLFLVTLLATGRPLLPDLPAGDYLLLAASGVIAIAISDTLFHMGLNRVGAGLNAIVDTLYAPFTTFFAFLWLHEKLGPAEFAGMGLIIAGVVVASRTRPPPGTDRRTLVMGIVYGVAAMATLAFGIVIAKPVLVHTDILWATTARQVGSLVVLLPAALLVPGRAARLAVFRPDRSWRFMVPGTVLGSYFALTFWIGGMKLTETGTAAALNQTTTIFILVFASVFLKERFGRRKVAAGLLALAGVVLVLLP